MNGKEIIPPSAELKEGHQEGGPKKKKVFVEVGTHNLPVTWLGSKKFGKNETYIGIDASHDKIREAKEFTEQDRPQENIYFLNADAEHLPLKNASADEVFFGNVFGDPSITDQEKDKFMQEAKRILDQGGRIVIKETNTPASRQYLKHLFEKHGLKVARILETESPQWAKTVKAYDRVAAGRMSWAGSYLLFVEPLPQKQEQIKSHPASTL